MTPTPGSDKLIDDCRFGDGCWRPLCPYRHRGAGRATKWARLWTFLASLEEPQVAKENLEATKDISQEHIPQPSAEAGSMTSTAATADEGPAPAQYSATTEPGLAEYSIEGAANGTTSAVATAVAKYAGEARPLGSTIYSAMTDSRLPGVAKYSATSRVAKSADEARPLGIAKYSATGTSAPATAVAKSADEARPPGFAKNSATTKSDFAVSSDEFAKSADEARPHGIAKCSAMTESELSVSSDEAGPPRSKANGVKGAVATTVAKYVDGPGPLGLPRTEPPQQRQSQTLLSGFGVPRSRSYSATTS